MLDEDIERIEDAIRYAGKRIAVAITADAAGNQDATGGRVESLTEAVMGLTAAMQNIAYAIERHSDILEN